MATFIDKSADFQTRMQQAIIAGLTECGINAVSYAKKVVTEEVPRNGGASWYKVTGALRNSISSQVAEDENCVYIGTNLKYAKYNEYGTGVYAEDGKGKQGYWVFVPGSDSSTSVGGAKVYTEAQAKWIVASLQAKGIDAHMTNGMKPIHMLKRAIEEHIDAYKEIMFKWFKKY